MGREFNWEGDSGYKGNVPLAGREFVAFKMGGGHDQPRATFENARDGLQHIAEGNTEKGKKGRLKRWSEREMCPKDKREEGKSR